MAVGRACARADRAPASSTSAAMVRRSPGGSEAMLSAVHAVTPGVNPVTPPGCSMVPARTDAGGDERSSGLSTTGTLAGISWTASGREGDDAARVRRGARACDDGPRSPAPRRVRARRRGGRCCFFWQVGHRAFRRSVDGEREVRVKTVVKNEWCFSRGYVTRRRSLSRPRNTSRSPSLAFSMYARARASARSRLATQTFSELYFDESKSSKSSSS